MGWLTTKSRAQPTAMGTSSFDKQAFERSTIRHIEKADLGLDEKLAKAKATRRRVDISVLDEDLDDIPDHEVKATKDDNNQLWIVVDNIVYDCSEFVYDHPGGTSVIESFRGEDCTWQFWTFHTKQLMQDYGKVLRVGRTSGIENRFTKKPQFIGLRKLGASEEDW